MEARIWPDFESKPEKATENDFLHTSTGNWKMVKFKKSSLARLASVLDHLKIPSFLLQYLTETLDFPRHLATIETSIYS